MFDLSYRQNIHSQGQNRCFKEFAIFGERYLRVGGGEGRVEMLFGQILFEYAVSLLGASLKVSF